MTLFNTIVGGVVGGLITMLAGIILWRLNARHTMRMAVLEKRFQAHQEAYALLKDAFVALYAGDDKERHEVSGLVYEWWATNNFYLDQEPRSSVDSALELFAHALMESDYKRPADDRLVEIGKRFATAANALETAVELPPLADPLKLFRD